MVSTAGDWLTIRFSRSMGVLVQELEPGEYRVRKIRKMEDFTADNVFVDEYVSWPGIKAKLKV